ncbi:MAG: SsrA-binding protein SmpB [Candidatus Buchananbacteria bacterium]|nr:SsrA-binding protein SmpB [Candidatus Buchananbacteria bacterium]
MKQKPTDITKKKINRPSKTIATNKEGLFNYEIIEKYQAGLVLSGPEVKAAKLGQMSLKGSYVTIDNNSEVWLIKSYITPYKPAKSAQAKYDPGQKRKLLLHKEEISSLLGKSKQKGLTIIPINVYTKRGLIKADIALARGKTKIDKRETIKKREASREIARTLKQRV